MRLNFNCCILYVYTLFVFNLLTMCCPHIQTFLHCATTTMQTSDESGWKNSVRHNLSIHAQFRRISAAESLRDQNAHGKMKKTKGAAGLWTVRPLVRDATLLLLASTT